MSDIPTADAKAEGSQGRWGTAMAGSGDDWREAFTALAASYWYCVYAWWRRAGLGADDAGTATLACFTRWLTEAPPSASDTGADRVREWIPARLAELAEDGVELTGPAAITIDPAWAERRYTDEPPGEPDAIFQRRWAITVIEFTAATLEGEYAARGEEALFTELLAFAGFTTSDEQRYAAAAARVNRTSGAMRKAVFDFRTRQREVLRAFAADTVLDPENADNEITALLCAYNLAASDAAGAPLPSSLQSLQPDEVLARAMQSVRMSKVGPGGWQPPTVGEAARLFPQYEVLALLGRGGMGAVYKARQIELDRFVAIKLLPLEVSVNADFAERFRREARALAKLDHPNILAVHKFGTTDEGHLFFVMEFVEGANLHQMIRGPGLAPLQALSIIGAVCDALAYAHSKGVIHRDIKPANVMVSVEGHVKVADFGLVRLTDSTIEQAGHTVTGTIIGTADYMAPEQMHGQPIDHRADIYSLGVMLYEMLCREVPRGIFDPPSTRTRGINVRVDHVVTKAMQQRPERRYQSTVEMKSDVTAAINVLLARPGKPGAGPPRPVVVPVASTKKSNTPLWLGAAAVLVAAAVIFLAQPKNPSTAPSEAKGGENKPVASDTARSATVASKGAVPAQTGSESPSLSNSATAEGAPKPAATGLKAQSSPGPDTAAPPAATTPEPSPLSATGKWLAAQEPQWLAAYANEVKTPFEKGADDLKKRYGATLDTQFAAATRNRQLETAVALRAEQKLLADGGEVPAVDESAEPLTLKVSRAAYRKNFAALDAERTRKTKNLLARYDEILGQNQALLTQRERLDEALELKAERERLAAAWLGSPAIASATPPPPAVSTPSLAASATKDAPFINSLGMKFVPVPILGGPTDGQRVLFSIWDTRVQDYEVFAKETNREWPKPDFEQGPTHPAVNVNWEDARAFCQWLTAREQAARRLSAEWRYRLPSDHEWSCAVGIGEREDATKLPTEKSSKLEDVFPWGTEWPPPTGAGNYSGEEMLPALAAGKYPRIRGVITGYNDGFENTSPVGSFSANRFGLYDMGGNVSQWCEDWFDKNQKERVRRGVAWNYVTRMYVLSSCRESAAPGNRGAGIFGFRCVADGGAARALPGTPMQTSQPATVAVTTKDAPITGQGAASSAPLPKTEIRSIRELKFQQGIVAEGVYRLNWPCLKINLWTTSDLKGNDTVGKAYYFDAGRTLLSKLDAIPNADHPDGSYGLPPLLKAHTEIDVYVPIESADKAGKWRSVVLVFGDPQKLVAEVYPRREGSAWKDFDFPEREKLMEQLKEAEGKHGAAELK